MKGKECLWPGNAVCDAQFEIYARTFSMIWWQRKTHSCCSQKLAFVVCDLRVRFVDGARASMGKYH